MDATEGVKLFVQEFSATRDMNRECSVISLELILFESQVETSPDIPELLDRLLRPGAGVMVSRPTPKSLLRPAVVAGEAPKPCIPSGDIAGTW